MSLILDGTNGVSDIDGTAATPAIRGTDTNTGIFFPAADTIAFAEGGTEVARFDSSGNLGVGTTTPSTYNAQLANYKAGGVGTYLGYSNSGTFPKVSALSLGSDAVSFTHTSGGSTFALAGSAQIAALQSASSGADTNLAFYTTFNGTVAERMRIDSSGNLLIGTTTPNGDGISLRPRSSAGGTSQLLFNRASTTTTGYPVVFQNGGSDIGYIQMSNTTVAYVNLSDYRLKENIAPMTGALDRVAQLKPVTYNWKVDGSDGQGFIAHELQAVVPDCVTGEKDAVDAENKPVYQGIDTSFLVATLTAAIQELKAIVDAQTIEIQALKGAA